MARPIKINALDNFQLQATLFDKKNIKQKKAIVVFASAMAVPQQYYHKYAQFLANHGFIALTFDYRGTGLSQETTHSKRTIQMADWGEYDLCSVLQWCSVNYPEHKIFVIAQSAGGQLVGITPNNHLIDGMILVTSQSGYWGHWSGREKFLVWLLWYLMIPVLSRLFSVFPGKFLGLGDNIPSGVARQWAFWGRHPEYIMTHKGACYFKQFNAPILCYSFSDDALLAPKIAVKALLEFYQHVPQEWHHINPEKLSAKTIGHFGFFREKFTESLWQDSLAWLEQQSIPVSNSSMS